jgi:acyl carrier protein
METALDKLKSAFAESIALPPGTAYDDVAYGKTNGWDSVAHMALISRIEEQFDIMLETDDVIDLSSFPRAREIVSRYGIAFE